MKKYGPETLYNMDLAMDKAVKRSVLKAKIKMCRKSVNEFFSCIKGIRK